jgi:hypothetical protein
MTAWTAPGLNAKRPRPVPLEPAVMVMEAEMVIASPKR